MTASSRTPEGEPNRCPVCRADVRLDPSRPPGDAPCPQCGHLLWFPGPVLPSVSASPEEQLRQFLESVVPHAGVAKPVVEAIRSQLDELEGRIRGVLVDHLSEDQIRVALRLIDGWTIEQVSAEMQVPESQVRQVLHTTAALLGRTPGR